MEFEYLLRIIIAGFCGALIGYERKSRMKEAGIRTHFVVAVGASLMMIISKYAFQDQTNWHNLSLDPSRIAAQVVSGVGFLGAGMIFMQKQTVKGLTTAAGIWATAGTGMAVGAGLYVVGGGVTLIILIAQILLHGRITKLVYPKTVQLTLCLQNEKDATTRIKSLFHEKNISIISFHAEYTSKEMSEINVEIFIKMPSSQSIDQLFTLIQEEPSVKSVEIY
ncbi:MgtC/SapB family protein [Anoxybacillus rupiensis]|uniref:MgtC/SapB family protein n=1 Tax=Anoxybacteroides rupiense TaxID=311460 RepID=A0ABT5W0C7_9BACL|nr:MULTISPECIES: MgtC/SapB family protein [Anoxybacillus]MBS2771565.1 MgtC/SapB family protein [Anoxybacillus rupiensis]MDE8562783.1 MgtC/SapB family protein [Anoxybacillus rupiensis]QHC04920.1 MgtC/SapB family protein [Anoxybacillus sp. PDR2]